MGSAYLWIKAFHVAFMVTWFAGLFYLPRLFIYHQSASDDVSRDLFVVMERRLFIIMTIGLALTTIFGVAMLLMNMALLSILWFQLKLGFLVGLFVYHYRCYLWMQRLKMSAPSDDTKWLRWFNEIPVIFLLGIILLAVIKPV